MKIPFKTNLEQKNICLHTSAEQDFNPIDLIINWSVEFSINDYGLGEPSFILQSAELIYESLTDELTDNGYETETSDRISLDVSDWEADFCFCDADINGFIITNCDVDFKNKELNIY